MQNKLQELKEMHEKGLISKEIYEEQQRVVLSNTTSTASVRHNESNKPKKKTSWIAMVGSAILLLLGGIWFAHKTSDQQGKDNVNEFVTATGIGTIVVPWEERADTLVRKLVEKNQVVIGQSIQGIAHPTGRDATLINTSVDKFPNRIDVNFKVKWFGGFLGGEYTTDVRWRFDKSGHVSAEVISDTAMIGIEQANANQLDNYFRTEIYPIFKSGIGD